MRRRPPRRLPTAPWNRFAWRRIPSLTTNRCRPWAISTIPTGGRWNCPSRGEGAGVTRIPYTNIWQTAAARRRAEYFAARQRGDTGDYSLPAADQQYVLLNEHPVSWVNAEGQRRERVISILSARSIEINGTTLDLTVAAYWTQQNPGSFTATVLNGNDEPVARIHRRWGLGSGYDITLSQTFENLTRQPMDIVWAQYRPRV